MGAFHWQQRRYPCVQRHETTSVMNGQTEEISVRDLSVTHKKIGWDSVVRKADVIGPEDVILVSDNLAKQSKRLSWGHGFRDDLLIRGDSDESTLGHGTCGPSF